MKKKWVQQVDLEHGVVGPIKGKTPDQLVVQFMHGARGEQEAIQRIQFLLNVSRTLDKRTRKSLEMAKSKLQYRLRGGRYANPTDAEVKDEAQRILTNVFGKVKNNPAVPQKYKDLLTRNESALIGMLLGKAEKKARKKLEELERLAAATPVTTELTQQEMIINDLKKLLEDPATLQPYEEQIMTLVLTPEEEQLARQLAA